MGIDENGLGPRLGPLVVTAVVARVTGPGAAIANRKPRGALATRVGDSKAMVSHGDVMLGEAWARAIGARMGINASDPDALIHALSLDARDELRRICPSHVASQCWSAAEETFEADAALLGTLAEDLAKLRDRGVDVLETVTAVVCTKKLNAEKSSGRSRFDVDLHTMERIVLSIAARNAGNLEAVCGKVGGYARYSDAFGPLGGTTPRHHRRRGRAERLPISRPRHGCFRARCRRQSSARRHGVDGGQVGARDADGAHRSVLRIRR